MATYKALATVTVGAGGAANIEFTNIPQTYTDLIVKLSGRSTRSETTEFLSINLNSSASDFTNKTLEATGTTVYSGSYGAYIASVPAATATASTFGSFELYIPNYAGSNFKSSNSDSVSENNLNLAYSDLIASLWSQTAPITSVKLVTNNASNFVQYTTATLYGVFKGPETLPSTPTIGTATATSATTATVAFTPTSATNVDASYTALSSPGSITATGTSSPVTVTGLTAGTAYTFQVRANNPGGSSAYSAASNSITPPTSYESIATVNLSSPQSTIAFTSIPSTFTHLQLRGIVRANAGSTGDNLYIRFNSDTANNYTSRWIDGIGSTTSSGSVVPWDITLAAFIPTQDFLANVYSNFVVDIVDYANTNKFKTFRSLSGTDRNGAGRFNYFSGLWRNTTAISNISFICSGDFRQFSSIALYGIKA
jgi:hypothetical protein